MDRQLIYPGQIPLETDLLHAQKNDMIGLAKLAAAMLGTSTMLNGLACTPTAPAGLTVDVAPGEIYSLQSIDGTAYSSIAADTTHQIVKQGISLDTVNLSCPAPGTAGQSINYLVQIAYTDTDADAVVLPYYNASNPTQAYSGPNNAGTTNNTVRKGVCTVAVKAGIAATTGTQITPAPDAGYVGAWVVTVANGQATIADGNITRYGGAPFIPSAGLVVGGLQGQACSISAAGGTANAITGSFTPGITALTNGMTLFVRAGSANTTTTPTFTPANGTITAKTIVKGAGAALAAGDIAGAGHWLALQYDATLDRWVLLNPAYGVSSLSKQIQSINASVSANALTLNLNPTSLDFRSATLWSGTVNTRNVSSALSLVVPSGATLGTASAMSARLVLLALDNAGTVELAVANLAGGNNLDETTLISTTAISGTSNSNNVIYSATARANVPFRVVGFIDIYEAVAGTWASAPTAIQGIGGQALAALGSLGFGQLWQDVKASRAAGTTYTNTTGKPIAGHVSSTQAATGGYTITVTVNGVALAYGFYAGVGAYGYADFIVPPGATYSVTVSGGSLATWLELR